MIGHRCLAQEKRNFPIEGPTVGMARARGAVFENAREKSNDLLLGHRGHREDGITGKEMALEKEKAI